MEASKVQDTQKFLCHTDFRQDMNKKEPLILSEFDNP